MRLRTALLGLLTGVSLASAVAAEKQLLWGDTHLHTANSFDAILNGNKTAGPEVAYRFARGEPVIHPLHRARMQLRTPLDFLVIADHAEYYGVGREVFFRGLQLEDAGIVDSIKAWFTERYIRRLIGGDAGPEAFRSLLPEDGDPRSSAEAMWSDTGLTIVNADNLVSKAWKEAIALADRYNEPGEFTALIGWEWTSMPGGGNLHRVVFTDGDAAVASQFVPFGSDQNHYPEALWDWLETTSATTGAEFIAIPHNSNISKGAMFDDRTLTGESFTRDYAEKRLKWEPVAEVTQIKGDSETHPLFSPDDEFADFETYPWYIQQNYQPYNPGKGDYVRPALKTGLELESVLGINPYQFGLIGSTDSHSGLATAEEDYFSGKMARDSTPETKSRSDGQEDFATGWSMAASGLAAVWSDANDRESIMAAFKRREAYATTGSRIALQFFGGYRLSRDWLDSPQLSQLARKQGVPMGSVLPAADQAPVFLVNALKDPTGVNLDRIQIVKGWLDSAGRSHEKIFNVAWSGDRQPGTDGKLPPVGDTVNRETGKTDNRIGAAKLSAYWKDPDYQPGQSAFYYVRVLEIPRARHVYLDALALGLDAPKEGASFIQDRAYSSPIWISAGE